MKSKFTDEYKVFKRKIMLRFLITAFIATGVVLLFYFLVWYERAGYWIISVLQYFGMTKHEAFEFYHCSLRQNKSVFFIVAIILIFMILLRYLFVWLIRYFNHINDGIDELLMDDNHPLHLLPEMEPMEKKLNTVKQTLWQRKQDSILAEQRKDEVVMYLAHDIRTPLTSVIGYLNLLEEEPKMPMEQRAKYVHITLDKACRLEKMINEFFEITRFNSSNITFEYSVVNLTRMLEQLVFEFKPMLAEKNLNCVLTAEPNKMIRCDVNKMQRVFDNLLRNAVNYSFENTEISIAVTQSENMVHIKFANHGNTIAKEKLERIFEQFYRLDTSRSTGNGGAGLGLAVAKEIVMLHGGTITARSENEIIEFEVAIVSS